MPLFEFINLLNKIYEEHFSFIHFNLFFFKKFIRSCRLFMSSLLNIVFIVDFTVLSAIKSSPAISLLLRRPAANFATSSSLAVSPKLSLFLHFKYTSDTCTIFSCYACNLLNEIPVFHIHAIRCNDF